MTKKVPKTVGSVKTKKAKISPEQYFVLYNGESLKSIHELALHIEKLDENVYNHHVNSEKNDFANWVSGVFEEHELAKTLRNAENRHESHIALLKHLAFKK